MEKILKIFGKQYDNINQAAFLLGSFAFLSQILGLLRDRMLAHFVGPSASLDAYYAAFRVPDFIFISIASLASITVIIPFVAAKMPTSSAEGQGHFVTKEAGKFLSDVLSVFLIVIVSISFVALILMPYLISFIAPGFTESMQDKVVELSRIMLLSPILLGLSNLFGSLTQIFRKFFIYALSPIFYNLGIIAGILFLYPIWGIGGLALGVVLGALMHFSIQVFSAWDLGFMPRFSFSPNFQEIKRVILVSLPRTLGLSLNNLALMAIIALASFLEGGSISIFNLSFNLQAVPLGIVGLSYAVAAFPLLTKSFSSGKIDEFKTQLKSAARAIIFWSLPITFLFIVLRAQVVRVILGSGSFSWENTRLVAASLAIFSVSIMAQGLIALLARAYYAGGNTRRPLLINLFSSSVIVIFSFLFLHLFNNFLVFRYFIESLLKVTDVPGTEVLMLPLAYSCGTILNFILLAYFAKKDFLKKEQFITRTFWENLSASFFIGVVAYIGLNIFSPIFGLSTFWGVFFQGLVSGVLGLGAGALLLYLFGSKELENLINTLHTKFWKTKVIAPPQEGL